MIYVISAVPLVLLAVVTAALLAEPRFRRRNQARRQAEEKGFALLRAWLTPEQASQWDARNEFEVIGCDTGTRYRIKQGTAMNIHQLDRTGLAVPKWCFMPEAGVVTGDVLLAQKIALETMVEGSSRLGKLPDLVNILAETRKDLRHFDPLLRT
jgi:hypothetical protein